MFVILLPVSVAKLESLLYLRKVILLVILYNGKVLCFL
jgi:hypothetical protein